MTDIHIFPVCHISDDPEGFGMVAIEAAAHGAPTVAFATGELWIRLKMGFQAIWLRKVTMKYWLKNDHSINAF